MERSVFIHLNRLVAAAQAFGFQCTSFAVLCCSIRCRIWGSFGEQIKRTAPTVSQKQRETIVWTKEKKSEEKNSLFFAVIKIESRTWASKPMFLWMLCAYYTLLWCDNTESFPNFSCFFFASKFFVKAIFQYCLLCCVRSSLFLYFSLRVCRFQAPWTFTWWSMNSVAKGKTSSFSGASHFLTTACRWMVPNTSLDFRSTKTFLV